MELMANFKITATTTVAELKEQFHNEFGGILRVYQGRSEAPEDATLVSLGGKVGELECRASRTVGKFIEAFQSELGLKVKVYTKDNWVSVLDGITLATVREIPKNARKAQMKQYLAYQRDEEEEVTEEAKPDEVEIPEEYKGVPIFEISMTEINVNDEELEDWDFPRYPTVGVVFHGYENNASQGCVIVADNHSELCETAKEFIENEISEDEDIPVRVIESKKIEGYGKASDKEEFTGVIGCALNEYYDGGNKHSYEYEWEDWAFDKAIFIVDDDIFMGYSNGGIDFIDLDDKQIEALKQDLMMPNLDELDFDEETKVASFQLGDKYGVINTEGTIVVPAIYDDMSSFTDGGGMARVELDEKKGYINPNGETIIPIIYDKIGWEGEGLIDACKDGKYGYIDTKGNVIIPFEYQFASGFNGGIAIVRKDNNYGCINTKNETVIPFEYFNMEGFKDGMCKVEKLGKRGYIDNENKVVIPIEYDQFGYRWKNGMISAQKDGKWGVINTKNEVIVPFEYDNGPELCNGIYLAKKDGKYGYLNENGEVVIPFIYDWADGFYGDGKTARVEKDGNGFRIDRNGNVVEE